MIVKKSVLNNLKLVIFDVDGTMYNQSKLRRYMAYEILKTYALKPWKLYDLFIIYHFRRERSKRAGYGSENLEQEQYQWCAKKVGRSVGEVRAVINRWIFEYPTRYLSRCVYPGIADYIMNLRSYGITTATYSDYPSDNKLESMKIYVDLQVDSTSKAVNSMKPSPKGLQVIMQSLNVYDTNQCLFIGDRKELDGECAENAQMPFLLIDKRYADVDLFTKLSYELNNNLNERK